MPRLTTRNRGWKIAESVGEYMAATAWERLLVPYRSLLYERLEETGRRMQNRKPLAVAVAAMFIYVSGAF